MVYVLRCSAKIIDWFTCNPRPGTGWLRFFRSLCWARSHDSAHLEIARRSRDCATISKSRNHLEIAQLRKGSAPPCDEELRTAFTVHRLNAQFTLEARPRPDLDQQSWGKSQSRREKFNMLNFYRIVSRPPHDHSSTPVVTGKIVVGSRSGLQCELGIRRKISSVQDCSGKPKSFSEGSILLEKKFFEAVTVGPGLRSDDWWWNKSNSNNYVISELLLLWKTGMEVLGTGYFRSFESVCAPWNLFFRKFSVLTPSWKVLLTV